MKMKKNLLKKIKMAITKRTKRRKITSKKMVTTMLSMNPRVNVRKPIDL